MKTAWESPLDPTYSPKNLILSGITGFFTVLFIISGYFFNIQPSRHPYYERNQSSDMIFLVVLALAAFGFGIFLTYLLRRRLTEFVPAWISSSFIGVATLLYPLYSFTYFEMVAVTYSGEGIYNSDVQDWRAFLTALLISLILFCITSLFSAAVNHFSSRRSLVLGLR